MSVSALLGAPSARDLFRRAIIQSGPAYSLTLDRASATAEEIGRQLAVPKLERSVLESVPATELVAAVGAVQARLPAPGEIALSLLPVVDGHFLPDPPEVAVRRGDAAGVELMIGTTRDEMSMFALGSPEFSHIDNEGLLRWIRHAAPGADADLAISVYNSARNRRGESTADRDLWVAMGTDVVFRWPTLRLATAQRSISRGPSCTSSPMRRRHLGNPRIVPCARDSLRFRFSTASRRGNVLRRGRRSGSAVSAHAACLDQFRQRGRPFWRWRRCMAVMGSETRGTRIFGPDGGVQQAPRDEELKAWEGYAPLDALGRV